MKMLDFLLTALFGAKVQLDLRMGIMEPFENDLIHIFLNADWDLGKTIASQRSNAMEFVSSSAENKLFQYFQPLLCR